MRRHDGFTLAESLVLIVMIAILAAILCVAFERNREKPTTSCPSNLRLLGMGELMYVQDNDGMFQGRFVGSHTATAWGPGPTEKMSWASLIEPYVKNAQLFTCPSYSGQVWVTDDVKGNYGYNLCALGADLPRYKAVGLAMVKTPAETVMLGDSVCCGLKGTGSDPRNCLYIGAGTNTLSYPNNVHPRMSCHDGGLNLVFVDGHVKWFAADSVQRGTFWARK